MPTYLYKNLDTGEIYELQQSMRDDAYTAHPQTGVPVKRIVARPGIAFKGSGFYVTDSRPPAKGEGKKEGGSGSPASGTSGSGGSGSGGSGSGTSGSGGSGSSTGAGGAKGKGGE